MMSRPADLDKMSDADYIRFMNARRKRFYEAGFKLKPETTCNICSNFDTGYVCIEHELYQLEEEGY